MQRTITILVCMAMLAHGAQIASSQGVTIDSSDVKSIFAVGNYITYHIDTLTASANIGAPGQTSWNFGGLKTTSVKILKSVPAASTPYTSDFPQATHALRDTAFTYSFYYAALATTITLNGTGFAYHTLGDNLLNYGLKGAGTAYLMGNPYPAQGQWLNVPPSIDYDLPLYLSKAWTTDYTETISGSGNLNGFPVPFGPIDTRHTITYSVDAYGPLTLPGGRVQEALRIRKSDGYVSSSASAVRVGYIFLAKNGAAVQLTVDDTSVTGGIVSVHSVQWIEGIGDAVPIELASFTATQEDEETVRLEWMTLSETNNFGFYILRKCADDHEFVDLPGSFVEGHGTTIVPQKYSYLDSPGAGAWWYQLKQIDLDGTVNLSEPTLVFVERGAREDVPTTYEVAQNYPNPFNPKTEVRSQMPEARDVKLVVYDVLGREVAVLVNEHRAAGSYRDTFDGTGLASGVYFYRLLAGSFVQTRKMTLVR